MHVLRKLVFAYAALWWWRSYLIEVNVPCRARIRFRLKAAWNRLRFCPILFAFLLSCIFVGKFSSAWIFFVQIVKMYSSLDMLSIFIYVSNVFSTSCELFMWCFYLYMVVHSAGFYPVLDLFCFQASLCEYYHSFEYSYGVAQCTLLCEHPVLLTQIFSNVVVRFGADFASYKHPIGWKLPYKTEQKAYRTGKAPSGGATLGWTSPCWWGQKAKACVQGWLRLFRYTNVVRMGTLRKTNFLPGGVLRRVWFLSGSNPGFRASLPRTPRLAVMQLRTVVYVLKHHI